MHRDALAAGASLEGGLNTIACSIILAKIVMRRIWFNNRLYFKVRPARNPVVSLNPSSVNHGCAADSFGPIPRLGLHDSFIDVRSVAWAIMTTIISCMRSPGSCG